MREKKRDWRYSKFLAFPKYRRAITYKEASGAIKPVSNNISELRLEYNLEQRKLQAEHEKENEGQSYEEWFQEYADIFLKDEEEE